MLIETESYITAVKLQIKNNLYGLVKKEITLFPGPQLVMSFLAAIDPVLKGRHQANRYTEFIQYN